MFSSSVYFIILPLFSKCSILSLQDTGTKEEHSVAILVEFAIALMAMLDQINRESFQRFKLRIGMSLYYMQMIQILDSINYN